MIKIIQQTSIPIVVAAFVLAISDNVFAADQDITSIRKDYAAIRKDLPNMSEEQADPSVLGPSSEGGVLTGFRDKKGRIRLIKSGSAYEAGQENEELYYKNGKLFFALFITETYNVPMTVDAETAKQLNMEAFDPKKTTVTEDRYYFKNNKMIRWINEHHKIVSKKNEEYQKTEKFVLNYSRKVFASFKRK